MNDYMTDSDIDKELDFWNNYTQEKNTFKHKNFYQDFFNFSDVEGNCLEIGCGGSPFITYANDISKNINLHLLDPLIDQISSIQRYEFLKEYTRYNTNLLNFNSNSKYDFIICLNVLDHFKNNHIEFIDHINKLLISNGMVYIYYDIRREYSDGHYPIEQDSVHSHIKKTFSIIKESTDINPVHRNWSTVYKSYRAILKANH